jgi:hypothetical protein
MAGRNLNSVNATCSVVALNYELQNPSCACSYPLSSVNCSRISPLLSWKPKVHCRVHNSPSLVPLLNFNPLQSKLLLQVPAVWTKLILQKNLLILYNRRLGKTNIKHCKRWCQLELHIGPGTVESAVEFNSTFYRQGLIEPKPHTVFYCYPRGDPLTDFRKAPLALSTIGMLYVSRIITARSNHTSRFEVTTQSNYSF